MTPHHPPGPRRWTRWLGRGLARLRYALHVEPTWLECNRLDLPLPGLPAELDGYRVAHLSDLHAGRRVDADYLAAAVDLALAERPDLVALTGDFVHAGFHYVERAAAAVARCRAPDGVFAVLGNHDYSVRNALGIRRHPTLAAAVARAVGEAGARVLRNEGVLVRRGGAAFWLGGADDLWSGACDPAAALAGAPPGTVRVLLAHNPRTVDRLLGHRCEVVLSGHTHGGQVAWPGWGPVALGPKARRYAAGLYRHAGTYLYVNKGVGFGLKVRYMTRPEVAVLTLRRAAALDPPGAGP